MVNIERKFSLFATTPIKDSKYLTRSIRQIFATAFDQITKDEDFEKLEQKHISSLISRNNEVTPLEQRLFSVFYDIVDQKYEGENLTYQLKRANMTTTGDIYKASAEYIAHYYKRNSETIQTDNYVILNQIKDEKNAIFLN